MRQIVVVGGTSALAKHLLPVLANVSSVISMGRERCNVYCDISEGADSIAVPNGTNVLIHLAGRWSCRTDSEVIETEAVNALGTLKVCVAAHRAGVRHLVIVSSIYALLDERSSQYSIYSISKKHADELALHYCKGKKMPLTIIRPSQIYDEKELFRQSQPLLYSMVDNAAAEMDIAIYGSRDARRNYIHVSDVVEVIKRVADSGCTGVYSCTYPEDVTLSQVARAALAAFGSSGKLTFRKDEQDVPDNVFGTELTLFEKLKYFPQIDINEGMRMIHQQREKERVR